MVSRGEIWLTNLDPTVGSEIQKTRPCLVISPLDQANLNTVTIIPLTSKGWPAPYRVKTTFGNRPGLILTDQIRSVDKSRLLKKLGEINAAELSATLAILRDTFEE